MVKILKYNEYVRETGEYRKGSDKYAGLVHGIMLYLRNFELNLSKPAIIKIDDFIKNVNTTKKELESFINDSTNLINFDIKIEGDNVIITNLDKTSKQRHIWENKSLSDTFQETAIYNGKYYHHFGIHPLTCSLYGDTPDDIETLTLKIDDNQDLPNNNIDIDYWGWFDTDQQEFTMIYTARFLLNMCFPNGIKASEDTGQGKAYRLKILD